MKRLTFFLLFVITTSFIYSYFNTELLLTKLQSVDPTAVKVAGNGALELYPEDPNLKSAIKSIEPGVILPFAYSGNSGGWVYVEILNTTYSIRGGNIVTGFVLNEKWFVPKRFLVDVLEHSGESSIVLLVLMLLYMAKKYYSLKRYFEYEKRNNRAVIEKLNDNHQRLEFLERKRREMQVEQSNLTKYLSQLRKSEVDLQQKIDVEKKKSSIEREKLVDAFERKVVELRDAFEVEAERRENATVYDMQCSFERLSEKYDRLQREAHIFDVPFKSKNYESLLKGRLFELYIAKHFTLQWEYRILEWTPDKGYNEGLVVEANSNPDLVFVDAYGRQLSIECKFRAKVGTLSEFPGKVSWCSYRQLKKYEEFRDNSNIPVFIALGISGEASNPENIYIASLSRMRSGSEYVEFKRTIDGKKKDFYEMLCDEKQLEDWKWRGEKVELND